MAKLKWELLARSDDGSDIVTWRARVPGGWLVSVWGAKPTGDASIGPDFDGGTNWGGGLTFFPCSEREWDVEVESDSKKRRRSS